VPNPQTGTYYEDQHIASFLGILPTDDPQLIIYVVIENPKGEHYYGSRVAAPVFRELATALLPLRGIQTAGSDVIHHSGRVVVTRPEEVSVGRVVPDLIGAPKRALLPLFERDDLEVVFIGEGYVVRQEPAPGTPVSRGLRLILEFE
jgi:cell division protein FtsI (penicillin-binding protein 3)